MAGISLIHYNQNQLFAAGIHHDFMKEKTLHLSYKPKEQNKIDTILE